MTSLSFDSSPSLSTLNLKVLTTRKPTHTKGALPQLRAELKGVRFEPEDQALFHRVCRVPKGEVMPLTAPHILAAPLHLAMLVHKDFPISLLGLVHLRNRIVSHHPIPADAEVDLMCHIGPRHDTDRGMEFEIKTEVRTHEGLMWEEVSTVLRRVPKPKGAKPNRPPATPGSPAGVERSVIWRVPADTGRQYARVSGDYNPIHLLAVSAKLFGFKRAIAHGMWVVARAVAELEDEVTALNGPVSLTTDFKTPVFLPGKILFSSRRQGPETHFDVTNSAGSKPHIKGVLSPA